MTSEQIEVNKYLLHKVSHTCVWILDCISIQITLSYQLMIRATVFWFSFPKEGCSQAFDNMTFAKQKWEKTDVLLAFGT